ncbi:MAG: hypothetical protein ACYTEQ_05025 [Planctomycetota bacterium]|jgi:hypothetical protein
MKLAQLVRSRIARAGRAFLSSLLSIRDIKWILEYKLAKGERVFEFGSHQLQYFFHCYNNFGLTERAIEIPIIKHYLEQGSYENVLEIGNVTNHYYSEFMQSFIKKTVVDKYEQAYDVTNLDICEYHPGFKFDFIFSVSTFEHMDSDRGRNSGYEKGGSDLVSYAADNIRYVSDNLLKDGGTFVLTAPLGYAAEWDETLYSDAFGECGFVESKVYIYRKVSDTRWQQVDLLEGRKAVHNCPYRGVNYVSVVEFSK